ncbi:MAG: DNA mismatch repair protein MutS, partial [Gemmatimonadota bacterium]
HATGVLPYYLWTFTLLGCVIVWRLADDTVEASFKSASSGEVALRRFSGLFEIVAGASFRSTRLVQVQESLGSSGGPVCKQMRRLDRILACTEVRLSDFLHALLQAVTLWDFHVLVALERWREANGCHVAEWFDAFGELEALASLASLAHAHPRWAFPEFSEDDPPLLDAADLGHPLLPPDGCVVNDIQLGPPGKFLLLTGSNMSGKSTLLRAIGVNVVLAQAGAPVCASRLRLPGTRVFTAMYVHDSLTEGVSQYMAALNRLKLVVDAARRAEAESTPFLYLLDEILQGTNAAERQTAVRKIVRHMLHVGAIGAISTHDLTLAETEDLGPAADAVHFRETIEQTATGATLSFDYKLRPGIATSTNALRLMEIVGL